MMQLFLHLVSSPYVGCNQSRKISYVRGSHSVSTPICHTKYRWNKVQGWRLKIDFPLSFDFEYCSLKSTIITQGQTRRLPVHCKECWKGGQPQWESWTLCGGKQHPYSYIHRSSWTKMYYRCLFLGDIEAHSPAFDLMNGQQSLRTIDELKQCSHHLRNHTWFLADPAPKL